MKFFTKENSLVYCHDTEGLVHLYKKYLYNVNDWRLFTDSSKKSLKAVLLYNGNKYAVVHIGHSTELEESYESSLFLLEKIKYDSHKSLICGDFKIIKLLVGLQSGNIKYSCFLCLWDSGGRDEHLIKDSSKRLEWVVGSCNIVHKSLVDAKQILIPHLHVKLGSIKQFVKALNKDGKCFQSLRSEFPHISDAKIEVGISVGPDIRKLIKDENFVRTITATENNAWLSFKQVVQNCLGKYRDAKFKNIVSTMLKEFRKLGCLMSLKLHFLYSLI